MISDFFEEIKKDINDKIEETAKKTYKDALPIVEEDVKECWKTAIDEYYASYKPKYYERKGKESNLYNMLDTEITDKKVKIYAKSEKLGEHRVENDYIFYYMFLHGYHGGAVHNDGLYWRAGYHLNKDGKDAYEHWGKRAYQSDSPSDRFQNLLDGMGNRIGNDVSNIFYKHWSN